MGRKFESELAGTVAQHKGRAVNKKPRVVLAAVLSCIVVVASAATVLSMKASAAQGEPTEFEYLFEDGTNVDFLVLEGDAPVYTDIAPEGDEFIVKRASTLKMTEFNTPGNSPNVYAKFVYTVNVKLRDIVWLEDGVAGMSVSQLTIGGFGEYLPSVVAASVTIDGLSVPVESDWYTTTFEDGTYTLDLVMPDLPDDREYIPHNMVSLFLMWKVPMEGWDGSVAEVGFPEFQVPEAL